MILSEGNGAETVWKLQHLRRDAWIEPQVGVLRRAQAAFNGLRITGIALLGMALTLTWTMGTPPSQGNLMTLTPAYTQQIWWPHLADLSAVGAEYAVQPMTFAVHAEYSNRPSVVIVDAEGMVCFTYYGTFWGDRGPPSINCWRCYVARYTHSTRPDG